ncbi:MAG: flippase-like domain-containing protein [candidate division KSB1 bacterium]|nr:flippase-like domain-containing protein [candidate division KSB1 bacterium]MDZ7345473.1 flippase-like domain-containing protein [candidate division KSB1 bacterium]
MSSGKGFWVQNRAVLLLLVKVSLAISIIALLIRRLKIERLIETFLAADRFYLIAGAALLLLNLYIQFRKWQLVVRRINPSTPNAAIFFSLLVGLALGFVTPGRMGEIGRAAFVPHTDWAKLTGLLLIDKLIALAVLYFFGMIGLAHVLSYTFTSVVWLPILLSSLILTLLISAVFFHPKALKSLVSGGRLRVFKRLASGAGAITPPLAGKLLLYSILFLLTFCTQFVLFYLAFERQSLLSAYAVAVAVMFVKALLPISLGDLGVRESASVYLFTLVGGTSAAAFDASLLLFVVNVLFPALIGLILFLGKRFNNKVDRGN